MKVFLLLLFMIGSMTKASFAKGQHFSDSLQTILITAKPDTAKINTLNALANEFRNSNPDSAIYFAKEAMALATSLNDKIGMADSYLYIAIALTHFNKYEEAKKSSYDALKLYDELITSAKTSEKRKLLKQKSRSYNNLGNIFTDQSNYPEALKCFYTSLKIREEIGDKKGIADSYNNLGVIYVSQSNYPEALKNYSSALKIYQEVGDKPCIARSYNNIGVTYYDQEKYPEALKHFITALKIVKETGNKDCIAANYMNIANVYQRQDKFPLALENYFTSLKNSQEVGNKTRIAHVCHNIGVIYTAMKKTNEASFYLNKGLSLAKDIGSLDHIQESYRDLSKLDSDQGRFKQALDNYKMFITYRDSIYNKENTKKLVQTQMQYEFDKKEEAILADQEKKDIKQRILRYSILIGLAGSLLFLVVVYRQRNKISKEKRRSDELLLNILPYEVAEELKQTGHCQAKTFSMVTVMFADFKDFTTVSEKISAELLVDEINFCFSAFDRILPNYRVEKIKTVGDAYICVSGLPVLNYTHAYDLVSAAIEISKFMLNHKQEKEARGEIPFELRIGIHTGPVVAGIVGVKKFQYDIWGDTVNLAARMESSGEAGKVNISGTTYELVKDKFTCQFRGKIQAKNKGEVDMYFVEREK